MQKLKFIVEEMATEESASSDIPPKDKLVSRNAPPPIRQGGFLRTLNWPVVLFILCTHSLALYGFITVRMRSETMMITTFYGILYGLGEQLSTMRFSPLTYKSRNHCRIPPSVGA